MGLFAVPQQKDDGVDRFIFQPLAPWTDKEKLEKEKEVVGFYLSAHPLDSYKKQLKRFDFKPFGVSF